MEVFDPSLLAQNMQMRQLFIQRTNRVEQPVSGKSAINPTLETSIDFNLRTTGVLEKVIVTMRCRVTNGSAATAVLSNFGASNLVERFRLRDLSNEERIDVRGRELHIFNSARQESQFGSAYATNGGTGFGVNAPIFNAPASIAAGASADITMMWELPVAYDRSDMTGAILKNFTDQRVAVTVDVNKNNLAGSITPAENPNLGFNVYHTTTLAGAALFVYTGNIEFDVLEVYRDTSDTSVLQFLPRLDIGTSYHLKTANPAGVVANTPFPIGFAAKRQTLSSIVVIDNGSIFNNGSDVTDFALRLSGGYDLFRKKPTQIQLAHRQMFDTDPPRGVYYFSYRGRPISQETNGTVTLDLTMNSVSPTLKLAHSTESMVLNGVDLGSVPGAQGANVS